MNFAKALLHTTNSLLLKMHFCFVSNFLEGVCRDKAEERIFSNHIVLLVFLPLEAPNHSMSVSSMLKLLLRLLAFDASGDTAENKGSQATGSMVSSINIKSSSFLDKEGKETFWLGSSGSWKPLELSSKLRLWVKSS